MDDQARFESLEIKAMQLEDALAALSDVCARQQRELAELRQRLQGLVERLAAHDAPQGASATAHEPPPHY